MVDALEVHSDDSFRLNNILQITGLGIFEKVNFIICEPLRTNKLTWNTLSQKRDEIGARELTYWLKAPVALPKVQDLILSTHMIAYNHLYLQIQGL